MLVEQVQTTQPVMPTEPMRAYPPNVEEQMRAFSQSLSEKDRRRYGAVEAQKLGYGGLSYIASVLGCDRHTIARGRQELQDPETLFERRIRRPGGGRKPCRETIPALEAAFLEVLADYTAGSPMREQRRWTNLTQQEIAQRLQEHGITVSVTVVKGLLKKHDFVRRKAQKRQATGESAHREAQFARIAQLKEEYGASPNSILSMDTKKKS